LISTQGSTVLLVVPLDVVAPPEVHGSRFESFEQGVQRRRGSDASKQRERLEEVGVFAVLVVEPRRARDAADLRRLVSQSPVIAGRRWRVERSGLDEQQ
jgi:hypothetical protein